MQSKQAILLGASPHLTVGLRTPQVMLMVILALLPVTLNGIRLFGLNALLLVIVSVVSAVIWELLFQLATRQKPRIKDLSSVVTGLLLALILPPSFPLWMAAFGTLCAVVVAKEFFGGIGANPFNPALIGRAILLMSFPSFMTRWHRPFEALLDGSSTATPLGLLREAATAVSANAATTGSGLSEGMARVATSVGAVNLNELYKILFLGNRSGSIGETSILLILLGGIFLMVLRVIGPAIPLSMLASTALLSWAFGLDPLFALLSGGVVFAAFFMATDYSSSPITIVGKLIFGAGIGAVLVLIRKFGSFPEGVTYAILIMNAVSPFLDRLRQKKYGFVAPAKGGAK